MWNLSESGKPCTREDLFCFASAHRNVKSTTLRAEEKVGDVGVGLVGWDGCAESSFFQVHDLQGSALSVCFVLFNERCARASRY
jgi:hypothetical protein